MSHKQKLPKDWEHLIKQVEDILKDHAQEIALEAVNAVYFGKALYPKKSKNKKKRLIH